MRSLSIEKSLKNAMLTGNGLISWQNNTPTQYSGRQHQYFSPETRTFTQQMARYASDFVEAQMQGIDPDNPFEYQTRMIRMADIVKPTAAIQRNFDDYKTILVADRDIEYIMPGSKIVAMGNTWLVVNPVNVSGSDGEAVVRRCNAVWNFFDFYGNVISEPLVVENTRANANDSDNQQSLLITKGYFNVICQANEYTRQIDTNTRFILGSAAYRVTGYSDFETEFTGDYSSIRTYSYTIRYEEPNHAIDDMVNHVAGGKTFAWNVQITAPGMMRVGETKQLAASSVRNGDIVTPDGENPVSYTWESSNEAVLSVDETGAVTAIAEGTAQITATLEQNTNQSCSVDIEVTATQDGVYFTSTNPQKLRAFDNATISAAYFADGEAMDVPLVWTFERAETTAYSADVADDGMSAQIQCYGYSDEPLQITVRYGEYSATAAIQMEGI